LLAALAVRIYDDAPQQNAVPFDRRATRTDMLAESDGIAALGVARNEPRSLPEYWRNCSGFEGLPGNLSGKT